MATQPNNTTKYAARPKSKEARALSVGGHKVVKEVFNEHQKTLTKAMKKKLVKQIYLKLSAHAKKEEEIFYPALKRQGRITM